MQILRELGPNKYKLRLNDNLEIVKVVDGSDHLLLLADTLFDYTLLCLILGICRKTQLFPTDFAFSHRPPGISDHVSIIMV